MNTNAKILSQRSPVLPWAGIVLLVLLLSAGRYAGANGDGPVGAAGSGNAARQSQSAGFFKREAPADKKAFLYTVVPEASPELRLEGTRSTPDGSTESTQVLKQEASIATAASHTHVTHDFSIFDATTLLLHDDDGDGYYHYFSVIFDADVSTGSAEVYARLYLSLDGGPWNHYFTTEAFTIVEDAALDEYEVVTALIADYPPGYYDILIELYEVGWPDVVASRGPFEDYDLNYLPLEDEDYDYVYVDDGYVDYGVSVSGGCTIGRASPRDPVLPLLLFFSLIYLLYFSKRKAAKQLI